METLSKLTIALMMVALFSIALITYAINFGVDNQANVNLANDGSYSTINTDLSSDVQTFYGDVNVSNEAFQKSTISSQTDASEGGTQFKVTPATSLSMFKKALTSGWESIFGADAGFKILFTAILATLGFLIGLYAWKAWRGQP